MLCQFTVKNYKSIRDEVTFDMQAAAISEHEDRIIKDQDGEIDIASETMYADSYPYTFSSPNCTGRM